MTYRTLSSLLLFLWLFTIPFSATLAQSPLDQLASQGLSIIDPQTLQTIYVAQNKNDTVADFVYQVSGDNSKSWWYVKDNKWYLVVNDKKDFSSYEVLKANLSSFPVPSSNEFLFKVLVLQKDGTAADPKTINHPPLVNFTAIPKQIPDQSGSVTIQTKISDEDKQNTSLKVEFALAPDFKTWQKTTLLLAMTGTGDIKIDPAAEFFVGPNLTLETAKQDLSPFLIWNSSVNLPKNYNGEIKLRLTAFDGLNISQSIESAAFPINLSTISGSPPAPETNAEIKNTPNPNPATSGSSAIDSGNSNNLSNSNNFNNPNNLNNSNNQSPKNTKSPAPKACLHKNFPDVAPDHWAYGFIDKLHNTCVGTEPIIKGYQDGLFRPQAPISRFEFLKIALMANGIELKTNFNTQKKFLDIEAENNFFVKQVIYTAADFGIVQGYSNGNFDPTKPITRGEAATVLIKAAQLDQAIPFAEFTNLPWYSPYVYQIVSLDIMTGYEDGYFGVENNLLRSEAAKIVYKTMKKKEVSN